MGLGNSYAAHGLLCNIGWTGGSSFEPRLSEWLIWPSHSMIAIKQTAGLGHSHAADGRHCNTGWTCGEGGGG